MHVSLKSIVFGLATILGFTFFIPTFSSANVPKPAGIITQVAGQATLHREGLTGALPVKFRDRVFLQDKIHTQERTFVRVLLGGKALVTVRELSVLTITEDLNHATIDIESGIVGLSVSRKRMKPGEYIEIRTPHAIAAVRGTTVLTQVTTLTNMSVLEGFIDIAAIGTPTKTVDLHQLTKLVASGQGLGSVKEMSLQDIKRAHLQLQTSDNAAPGPSPLSDTVAKNQSDQAAALAEALAPAPDKKGSDEEGSELQTEESPQRKLDYIQKIPPVLPTKDLAPAEPDDLEMSDTLTVPPTKTFSTGNPQSFETAEFSGGTVDGTDTLTVTGTTTVNTGANTVENPFNNEGDVDVQGGSINFKGDGTHTGSFAAAAGTTLEFGGGTHDIAGGVTGAGTVEVSAGTVNVNGNVSQINSSITGGTVNISSTATLQNDLGSFSMSGGNLSLKSGENFSVPSITLGGGTISGTDTVTVTGPTTVSGTGTKTISTPFNNEGPLTLQGGTLRLLGGGTHTPGSFATTAGTTLEFGGGTHQIAAASLSGPGTASVTGGVLNTPGHLFALSGDLTTLDSLFQQTGGTTTIGPGDALAVGTHSLDASGTTDALFDISGGTLTTTGFSSDIIESRSGGGTVTTGGSAVSLSGTGSIILTGNGSSVLQSVGAGTSMTTGDTAVRVSDDAILDLDSGNKNDVALIQSGGSLEADGSVLSVSNSAEARVGRSVGRVESSQLTTTNGGHVLASTGGLTTMGNSILDMIGSTSQADVSGYVVYATGGQINGPAGFNLVDVNAGELNTNGGIIKAVGDDRIILDNGTTDAIVDITSADGTHDLGTTAGEAVFHLSGTSSTDTPLTKKDGGNNDMAIDQTLLRTSGATLTAKKFLIIDKALLDASAPLLQLVSNSTVTANPGAGNGFIEITNQAMVKNDTNTMPLLTLDNSMLTITGDFLVASAGNLQTVTIAKLSGVSVIDIIDGVFLSAIFGANIDNTGPLADFSGGTSTISVANNHIPTAFIGPELIPIRVEPGGVFTLNNTNLTTNDQNVNVTSGVFLIVDGTSQVTVEGMN